MTKIHLTTNASYNFVAPEIAADADKKIEVVFPTQEQQTVAADAEIAIAIERQHTSVDIGEMAANAAIDLTIADHVEAGATLSIKGKSDGTARRMTFGTGLTALVASGTINKTKIVHFMYDGTTFNAMGAPVQLD